MSRPGLDVNAPPTPTIPHKLAEPLAGQLRQWLDAAQGSAPAAGQMDEIVRLADALRRANAADEGVRLLAAYAHFGKGDAAFAFVQALCLRAVQDLEGAVDAISRARHLSPRQSNIAFAAAQLAFESWRPAADLFQAAQQLAPGDAAIVRNRAIALAEEGRGDHAMALLESVLERQPDWIEGLRQLASIRVTSGQADPAQGFAKACAQMPDHLGLRLAWFHFLVQAKSWDAAGQTLAAARARFGDQRALHLADIYLRAQTGGELTQEDLYGPHALTGDPGFDLCRLRYLLGAGRADEAEQIAQAQIGGAQPAMFWPYLGLCWRLTGDQRAQWLEPTDGFVQVSDLTIAGLPFWVLAQTLRALHTNQQPYVEQSVRGGTQTGRNLFFHHDPNIQAVRQAIVFAVNDYRAKLVCDDPAHPFLRASPDAVLFSGSWSVALRPHGFHAAHTHVLGWLSSVLYVDIPPVADLGDPPAGHLSLGKPPPELNLPLVPTRQIAPQIGRLVLFPSQTWHGTEPFEAGERLTIAFDVAPSGMRV